MSSEVEVLAAKYYLGKGIPPAGAVALTSVLYKESALRPGSQGDQPSETPGVLNARAAFGIASWNGPRQARLKDFCDRHSLPYNNLQAQLDFVLNEIGNYYPRSWSAIRSTELASDAIISVLVSEYENPADPGKEINGARALAGPLFAALQTYTPPAKPPASAGGTSMNAELAMLIAPIIESLAAGLIKGLLSHLVPQGGTAAPLVQFDPLGLAKLIAEELAKVSKAA
jgi:hypothetical protein